MKDSGGGKFGGSRKEMDSQPMYLRLRSVGLSGIIDDRILEFKQRYCC